MGSEIKTSEWMMDLEMATWYIEESWFEFYKGQLAMGGSRKYALEHVGNFLEKLKTQRMGQAFFNSLTEYDSRRIQQTLYDPFYGGRKETMAAIEFLTRKDGE